MREPDETWLDRLPGPLAFAIVCTVIVGLVLLADVYMAWVDS